MSKFHFDETVMDVTASELGTVKDSIDNGVSIILNTGLTIGLQKGFSVEGIFSDLSAEKDKLKYCGERLEEGRNVVTEIKNKISTCNALASSLEKRAILNYVELCNGRPSDVFRKYNYENDFAEKYLSGFDAFKISVSQIKTAALDTIKHGSYERELLCQNIASIIGMSVNDISISIPLSDLDKEYLELRKDIDGIVENFNSKYKSNPLCKYYSQLKKDVKLLNYLINDYTDNMEYLESLERTLSASGYESDMVRVVINDIKNDYNNKYEVALGDMISTGVESLATTAIKQSPVGKAVFMTLDIMEFADRKSDEKMDYAAITAYE